MELSIDGTASRGSAGKPDVILTSLGGRQTDIKSRSPYFASATKLDDETFLTIKAIQNDIKKGFSFFG